MLVNGKGLTQESGPDQRGNMLVQGRQAQAHNMQNSIGNTENLKHLIYTENGGDTRKEKIPGEGEENRGSGEVQNEAANAI